MAWRWSSRAAATSATDAYEAACNRHHPVCPDLAGRAGGRPEQPALRAIPAEAGEGRAVFARRRSGAARGHPGHPSHVELPRVPRVPGAVEQGLSGALHEPAIRQQRGPGALGVQRARRQDRHLFPAFPTRNHQGGAVWIQRGWVRDQLLSGRRRVRHRLLQRRRQAREMRERAGRPPTGRRDHPRGHQPGQRRQRAAAAERRRHQRQGDPGARGARPDRSQPRPVQPGQWLQPQGWIALQRRVRRQVLQGADGSHESAHRSGARTAARHRGGARPVYRRRRVPAGQGRHGRADAPGSAHPPHHRASAEGLEERRLGGAPGSGERARGAAGAGEPEPLVRPGHAPADAPFVPERQRHPFTPRHGRCGLVLDEQLRAVCRAGHLGADADCGDGRQQLSPVQRNALRSGQEPGQGLHRGGRRESRSDAVRAV